MSDSDYGFIVPAEVMDGEVVPYGKKFSEWHGWATNKYKKARQSVVIDGLLFLLEVLHNTCHFSGTGPDTTQVMILSYQSY